MWVAGCGMWDGAQCGIPLPRPRVGGRTTDRLEARRTPILSVEQNGFQRFARCRDRNGTRIGREPGRSEVACQSLAPADAGSGEAGRESWRHLPSPVDSGVPNSKSNNPHPASSSLIHPPRPSSFPARSARPPADLAPTGLRETVPGRGNVGIRPAPAVPGNVAGRRPRRPA